jgi:hypothetical protein
MSDENELDDDQRLRRMSGDVMDEKPKAMLTRSICFRLLAALLGTLCVTVAAASSMAIKDTILMGFMGIVFLFYALYGEHPFVYRILGVPQSSQPPISQSNSSELPSPPP